ncbi:MAG TPA: hypothetical protein DEF47_11930 [Herpetosiphon sp.]|uniref:Uncharacterized protein n=1 Tax=Herpetosiphon aurantiacus (strain ATCC 23779 / DSM 785 / 114-95) TaxID=316274 RepID=A9B5F3_HERA2|nr:hypothetical protein [Herpetosiphon sp.]ABX02778.1 hypothetical protein Haur_0126 [Herpetosiphon aurantiacus DSM 785]HBW50603.1 hypothetical protein [Herpetosiphon sp.]
MQRWRHWLEWLVLGGLSVLIARLMLLLFAANPEQPFTQIVLWLSQGLVWPLAWLDQTQPTTGVRFERGTFLLIMFGLVGMSIWQLRQARRTNHGME